MGNDIEIRVSVANNTSAGVAAVNRSLQRLQSDARDAGRALDGLAARATATSLALRALRDSAQDASRAIRSLNTTARTTDGRLNTLSDRSRTLRRDTDDLDGSMRRLTTTMGGLRGNNNRLNATFGNSSSAMDKLKQAAIMLSPALIPIAAAAVPVAANLTAAGVAVGAFGLAVAGQLVAMKGAADAQQKYTDAVRKYGPASEQAAQAETLFLEQVQNMDPATRKAAAGLSVLKTQYQSWSKSLAGDTMPVFTKGLAVAGALFPQLTPLVKGASTELDRFMTILAGGVSSSGFSSFMQQFSSFATGALSKANDALVHFMRTMSGGAGSSQFTEFMTYVKTSGPQVAETLGNLSKALVHVVAAASDTGLSMLSFVDAVAKLVNAIPSGVLSTFLQFAVALKAVKLAAAGMAALGGLSSVATSLRAMAAASAAAGGGLAGLRAAFLALSVSARAALITTGIGAIVVALGMLSSMGDKTPPDVNKVTTSLKGLAETGKNTGEAAKAWGVNFDGLSKSLSRLNPKGFDGFLQGWAKFLGSDSTLVKTAKEDVDSLDKSLADLVKGGKADVAAKALEELGKKLKPKDFKELKGSLDDYKSALADQALEAKLTAESQGLFGSQAQKTAAQLDAQKQSADGLRQSIVALNDVNRQGLGGMIGFEAAIDAASKAAKDNAGALSMHNGVLNLNSEKARNAASALQDLADKTDAAGTAQREAGASWETVNGIYSRGSAELVKLAQAMGLSEPQAKALAKQLLTIPSQVVSKVAMNTEDATRDLNSFNAAVRRSPGSKSVTLKTLSAAAEQVLKAFGYKVEHLPNGSVKISAAAGGALSTIRSVAGAIASLHDRHITLTTEHRTIYTGKGGRGPNAATGGLLSSLPMRSFANGGEVQAFPEGGYVQGPGGPMSDSVTALLPSGPARVSDSEYVLQASAVRKYGVGFLDRLNEGRLRLAGYASGGLTQSMKDARAQLRSSFGISSFGRVAGYQRTPFEKSLGAPTDVNALVSSLNEASGRIKAAFSGRTETSLLRQLSSVGKSLINYDKQLTKVTSSLASASAKLTDLKNSAAQLKDSVKSNILGAANITQGATAEDSQVTINTILSRLTGSRDQAEAFSSALSSLQKRGLRSDLIQQIAEAGISGGGLETAKALLGASSAQIKSVNSLQAATANAASVAGQTTGDAVYGAAIKAQEKLVNSLKAQQAKLEKAMANLAKVMEKAISRATGKAAGGIVGAAAAGGMRGGLTWVGEHEPELLDLPVGSRVWSGPDSRRKLAAAQAPWASMLTAPRARAAVRGGTAPSVQPVVVHQTITLDGKVVAQQIFDPLREQIANRGGNVQRAMGRGNG